MPETNQSKIGTVPTMGKLTATHSLKMFRVDGAHEESSQRYAASTSVTLRRSQSFDVIVEFRLN